MFSVMMTPAGIFSIWRSFDCWADAEIRVSESGRKFLSFMKMGIVRWARGIG